MARKIGRDPGVKPAGMGRLHGKCLQNTPLRADSVNIGPHTMLLIVDTLIVAYPVGNKSVLLKNGNGGGMLPDRFVRTAAADQRRTLSEGSNREIIHCYTGIQ